jgi:lysozyme
VNNPRGIDVSAIGQGRFDWQPWAGHISFAMVKATEGTDFTDPEFARNWSEAAEMGVFRFAYHFFRPGLDPATQAEFFIDTVKAQGLGPGDNLVMDFETTDGLPVIHVSFAAWVFAHSISNRVHNHRLLIYTYPFFGEEGNCAKLAAWPLWVADYGVPIPLAPPPWADPTFWQYAPGGNGRPDQDEFIGTQTDLENFCTTT